MMKMVACHLNITDINFLRLTLKIPDELRE